MACVSASDTNQTTNEIMSADIGANNASLSSDITEDIDQSKNNIGDEPSQENNLVSNSQSFLGASSSEKTLRDNADAGNTINLYGSANNAGSEVNSNEDLSDETVESDSDSESINVLNANLGNQETLTASNNDDILGAGTQDVTTFSQLSSAVSTGKSIINIKSDLNATRNDNGDILIKSGMTIYGENHYIDPSGASVKRTFKINSNVNGVTFRDITFINGANQGSAVYIDKNCRNIQFINCTFKNNHGTGEINQEKNEGRLFMLIRAVHIFLLKIVFSLKIIFT
ncbi:hypothetical protein [Methanobrevibacter sp.]